MSERYVHNLFVATVLMWLMGAAALASLVDWNTVDNVLQTIIIISWLTHGAALVAAFTADKLD